MKKLTELNWLGERILVLPDKPNDKFPGTDLYKPEIVKSGEKADSGVILAMGPGRTVYETGLRIPIDKQIKVGARILFGRHAGIERTVDDISYKILVESDILAVE